MIGLEELRPASIYRLEALGRSDDPAPWIAEVEDFVYGAGAAEVLRSGAGHVLLVVDDGAPIGAEHRGQGRGEPVLAAVVEDAHDRSGRDHVLWLVHSDNTAMRTISERVADEAGHPDDSYVIFVHDR